MDSFLFPTKGPWDTVDARCRVAGPTQCLAVRGSQVFGVGSWKQEAK